MNIEFAYICEGTSDEALVRHLEHLCVELGFQEASGVIPEFDRLPKAIGKTVEARVAALRLLYPAINVVFVHRDADNVSPNERYDEIRLGVESVGGYKWVGLVPVRELEAWLLVDEEGIRYVAENPNGTVKLNLPKVSAVEFVADPKELLWNAIEQASELAGRRLEKLKKNRSKKRRMLVERISSSEKIRELPSWKKLYEDIGVLAQT
jgi:hypothetical protein